MQPSRWLAGLACFGLSGMIGFAVAGAPHYPPTPKDDVVEELHGVPVADPYRWLENSDDPNVITWTAEENALTRSYLDRFAELRAELTKTITTLHAEDIASTPRIVGDAYFFTRRAGLQNHPVLYLRAGSMEAEPQVVLNPNELSDDGSVALDWWFPSPDGQRLLYGTSAGGSEMSTLHLRDVGATTDAALTIPGTRHCAVAWNPDESGFLYTRYPEAGTVPEGEERYYRHVFAHQFGTDWHDDTLVWGAGRPKEEWPDVYNSSDNHYQFLSTSVDWAKNDLYIRPAGQGEFEPLAVGLEGSFTANVLNERLYLLTNYEAPRYRLLSAPVSEPSPDNWQETVPEQKGVISDFIVADGKLVLHVMENAFSRVLIYEPDGRLVKELDLPTLGSVSGLSGVPGQPFLFFTFQSFAYPPVVFQYDLRSHMMSVVERMAVPVDLDAFETRQVWFNSKDGTRVPMFVTLRKDLKLDGGNPTVLYGYGGFNGSQTPFFYRACVPWLERGGIWAVANIRGGGEFGKEWHLAGRLEHKQNCFDDFIAAAEKLIADGYTKPATLGARGGSNGGLLMGAVLVQRPDLFGAIVCNVPLLDMLRYQNFSIARLWIPEYGTAEDPEQFKFLYAYSPYHHVVAGTKYPATLLSTATNDSRVDPMHARKMAAALQAATASDAPILLWVETGAGHGAGKPLSSYITQQVDYWTFFMWQLGMIKELPATQPVTTQATTQPM